MVLLPPKACIHLDSGSYTRFWVLAWAGEIRACSSVSAEMDPRNFLLVLYALAVYYTCAAVGALYTLGASTLLAVSLHSSLAGKQLSLRHIALSYTGISRVAAPIFTFLGPHACRDAARAEVTGDCRPCWKTAPILYGVVNGKER